ncbi:HAMP domain-containing sensor histidine kinase [Paludicola sp. MB14-C6]|uniref:sensor histidine kinase n=1 Tax=Paludihabitans sp. MB14-C6 TaxID=3070656 RepID=UPI0027DCA60E|nr:HAMP domain-containing sensor histidine kinase [Paludicola sp. MB14-C6]WMJ24019.1 HAMP domain-containing sensor histidine kinase [Paludicola sp. MB14-C6]
MKTLKQSMLQPFLLLLIAIPCLVLILFNIIIRLYIFDNAKKEITNTMESINTMIKKEYKIEENLNNDQSTEKAFLPINYALKASNMMLNTEVYLYNQMGVLTYPKDKQNTFLTQELEIQIQNYIEDKNTTAIEHIKSNGNGYLILKDEIRKRNDKRPIHFVIVSSLDSLNQPIKTINSILFFVLILGILIGVLIANRVSNKISRSVTELIDITKVIGEGQVVSSSKKISISELSQLQNSMMRMSVKLWEYDKAQKNFWQNASHELRTPLMSIGGYAEGIESGILTDSKEAAHIIGVESTRLNKLVEELLTLSKIDNNLYENQLESQNIIHFVKECYPMLNGFALKNGKEITLTILNEELYCVVDENLFYKIVVNVASNCIRYAANSVSILVIQNEGKAMIRISDDGEGIDKDVLPHIFERFYKGKGGNFGLGLAIADAAVTFMGGTIKAYNGEKGAIFDICFPIIKL